MMLAVVPNLTPLARVFVPQKTFLMGSSDFPDAQPVTQVTVSAFQVSETKATVGAYKEYLHALGDNRFTLAFTDPRTGKVSIVGRGRSNGEAMEILSPGKRIELGSLTVFKVTDEAVSAEIPRRFREFDDQPVDNVDWWEMLAFAAAHGGDLPTEAECERIMRRPNGAQTPKSDPARDRSKTSRTKAFPPNHLGVYDALGNVWNWTGTWYGPYSEMKGRDPIGPKQGEERVVRGGYYRTLESAYHAAERGRVFPYRRDYSNGRADHGIGGVVVWRNGRI